MNVNERLPLIPASSGIAGYTRAINQLTEKVNWLLGMRTGNGKIITETARGPLLDTSDPVAAQIYQPWLQDPDGNTAGWSLITCLNLSTNQAFDVWIWTGQTPKNVRNIPWSIDTNNNQAGWLIGAQGELWGTGAYPAGAAVPYQQVKFTRQGTNVSPTVWTGSLVNTPIVPPSSPPVLFFRAPANSADPAHQSTAPVTPIWMPSIGSPEPAITINFNWQITYDGTVIFNQSGSANFINPKIYVPLSTTGWAFDPTGLSGYTHGESAWIYVYNGPISANTNPPIIQTFTYTTSSGATVEPVIFGVTLYTG